MMIEGSGVNAAVEDQGVDIGKERVEEVLSHPFALFLIEDAACI